MPVELESPVRFDEDTVHQSYDPVFAQRCWQILLQASRVLTSAACDLPYEAVRQRPTRIAQFSTSFKAPTFKQPRSGAGIARHSDHIIQLIWSIWHPAYL